MALSCIICEKKWDIGRKLWYFHTPLHSAPPLGGSLSEYCHPVWYGKTKMVGLLDGEKILRICRTIYTQYWGLTDRRTDRETDTLRQDSPRLRAMHMRRVVIKYTNEVILKNKRVCFCEYSSSSHMHVMDHNWSATKQRLHLQSAVETSRHSVFSGDRIRQCGTSSGSRHKDTDQCL